MDLAISYHKTDIANAVAKRLGCDKAIIPNVGAALSAAGAVI